MKRENQKILTPLVSLDTPGKATVQVIILADPVSITQEGDRLPPGFSSEVSLCQISFLSWCRMDMKFALWGMKHFENSQRWIQRETNYWMTWVSFLNSCPLWPKGIMCMEKGSSYFQNSVILLLGWLEPETCVNFMTTYVTLGAVQHLRLPSLRAALRKPLLLNTSLFCSETGSARPPSILTVLAPWSYLLHSTASSSSFLANYSHQRTNDLQYLEKLFIHPISILQVPSKNLPARHFYFFVCVCVCVCLLSNFVRIVIDGVSHPFLMKEIQKLVVCRWWEGRGEGQQKKLHWSCFLRQSGYFAFRIWEGKQRKYIRLCLIVTRLLRRGVRAATPDEAVWPGDLSTDSQHLWTQISCLQNGGDSHRFLWPWMLLSHSWFVVFFFFYWSIVDS